GLELREALPPHDLGRALADFAVLEVVVRDLLVARDERGRAELGTLEDLAEEREEERRLLAGDVVDGEEPLLAAHVARAGEAEGGVDPDDRVVVLEQALEGLLVPRGLAEGEDLRPELLLDHVLRGLEELLDRGLEGRVEEVAGVPESRAAALRLLARE